MLSATNGCSSKRAYWPSQGSTCSGVLASASARLDTIIPGGPADSPSSDDSRAEYRPLTKTSRAAAPAASGSSRDESTSDSAPVCLSKIPWAIGATLVCRQFSCRRVGNPSVAKRSMARRRNAEIAGWLRGQLALKDLEVGQIAGDAGELHGLDHGRLRRFGRHGHVLRPHQLLRGRRRGGLFEPGVALLFELQGQLLAARADDPPIDEHVHEVGNDVVRAAAGSA